MNDFKVGQQVEIITDSAFSPLYESMLERMGNPTKVLGTIAYIGNRSNILIHSNQLEECGLGHSGNNTGAKDFKSQHEKGYWWVGASQLKPYHEQPSFSELDKLFKEEKQ